MEAIIYYNCILYLQQLIRCVLKYDVIFLSIHVADIWTQGAPQLCSLGYLFKKKGDLDISEMNIVFKFPYQ